VRPTDAILGASIFERDGAAIYCREGFHLFIIDETHLLACTRYVELNAVRAGIVKKPESRFWSSAKAHLKRRDDLLIKSRPLLAVIKSSWSKFLSVDASESEIAIFRKHKRTGRPIGDEAFIERLEQLLDRRLKPRKPGPKPRDR